MDAAKFHAIWKSVHTRAFGVLYGTVSDGNHYVQLKLDLPLRDLPFLAVMNRFRDECGDSFRMIGEIYADKTPQAQVVKDAREKHCTAWAWTPEGGLVGHRVVPAVSDDPVAVSHISALQEEMANEREMNAEYVRTLKSKISELEEQLKQSMDMDEAGGACEAKTQRTLDRIRAERNKLKDDMKANAERFRSELQAKDETQAETVELLSRANAAAADGLRARAMEAQLKGSVEALENENFALKSTVADGVESAEENRRLRAEAARFHLGLKAFVEHEVVAQGKHVVEPSADKVVNLKKGYEDMARHVMLLQSMRPDERGVTMERELKLVHAKALAECEARCAGLRTVSACLLGLFG